MDYRRIDAKIIPSLHFAKSDVLVSPDDKREREHQLVSATAITSMDHEEVGLVVQLEDGEIIEIVSDHIEFEREFVELKGGYMIPLRAIVKVEI